MPYSNLETGPYRSCFILFLFIFLIEPLLQVVNQSTFVFTGKGTWPLIQKSSSRFNIQGKQLNMLCGIKIW
jgi:hypothetical protein